VTIFYRDTDHELFWRNHTSNTAPMWKKAGCDLAKFDGKPASELTKPLLLAMNKMVQDESHYRSLDAPNKWGTYDSTLDFLDAVWNACLLFPDEIIRISA